MKTILVTGINGFLGSNLAITLSSFYNVIGIEKTPNELHRIRNKYFKIYSSTTNREKIFSENKIFVVIHAATIYKRNNVNFDEMMDTNVILPNELYNLCDKYNVQAFINTDSFFNNMNHKYDYLVDYTNSKIQSLNWLKMLNKYSKCKLINIKLFHMFGENDNPSKFVVNIITRVLNNEKNIDLTDGTQKRDFIYVKDVVNAYKIIINSICKIGAKKSEYELGSGNSISIRDFVKLIKKISKSKSNLNFGKLKLRDGEIMNSRANIQNLKNLGWSQHYTLDNAILNMVNYYKS